MLWSISTLATNTEVNVIEFYCKTMMMMMIMMMMMMMVQTVMMIILHAGSTVSLSLPLKVSDINSRFHFPLGLHSVP